MDCENEKPMEQNNWDMIPPNTDYEKASQIPQAGKKPDGPGYSSNDSLFVEIDTQDSITSNAGFREDDPIIEQEDPQNAVHTDGLPPAVHRNFSNLDFVQEVCDGLQLLMRLLWKEPSR